MKAPQFAVLETNETRYVGRLDAEATHGALLAAVAEALGLSRYTPGLSLAWSLGGPPTAPELTFNLVQDHRWAERTS